MEDLGQQLASSLQGRVCVMGVGNVEYRDDGFGVYLAERLLRAGILLDTGIKEVIIAGNTPENCLGRIAEQGFDHLLLLDAANFGGQPGAIVFLNASQIVAAFPQISTHKISLGVLARTLEAAGTHVWLLAAQPESLAAGRALSATLQESLEIAQELLIESRNTRESEPGSFGCQEKVLA